MSSLPSLFPDSPPENKAAREREPSTHNSISETLSTHATAAFRPKCINTPYDEEKPVLKTNTGAGEVA